MFASRTREQYFKNEILQSSFLSPQNVEICRYPLSGEMLLAFECYLCKFSLAAFF